MADEHDEDNGDGGHDDGHDHGVDRDDRYPPGETRTTAPQQTYTTREVGIGFAVLAAGLAVAYLLPYVA